MKSPFQFLDAYTVKDKDKFFGRDGEVAALYEMVHKNRLVLVYGQSGTGKTSAVQCGLAGRFDITDWYPINIRRGNDINSSFRQKLKKASGDEVSDSISETIQEIYATYLRPVYLIFDQLEELFILGDQKEQDIFIRTIAEILQSGIACRIIFVMREEFLAHLYEFENVVPNLFDRRLRVERMTTAKVRLVLSESFKKFNITLEPPVEERLQQMIEKISSGKAWIQLPYLQVYLDLLYREDYRRTYADEEPEESLPPLEFTKAEIEAFGNIEDVLEKFLSEQEQNIQKELEKVHQRVPVSVVKKVLDLFVTEEGTKRPVNYLREGEYIRLEQDALSELPLAVLTSTLEALEKSRILRFSDTAIELAHDSLAELIDRNRSDEDRQLNQIKRHLENNYQEHLKTGEYLSPKQINNYEDFLPKLTLEEHVSTFIEDSRGHNEKIRLAEIELNKKQLKEARERAEKEELLRNEAEEKGKKARRNFLISLVVAVIAGILGIFSALVNVDLKESNENTVNLLLREADRSILQLDYTSAFEITAGAVDVGAKKEETTKRIQELAYFYTESGQYDKADTVLRKIKLSYKRSSPSEDSLEGLRKTIKNIDPVYFDSLERKYYPDMVLVPGGEFRMGSDEYEDEGPPHNVKIDSFYMARTETTIWQYNLYLMARDTIMPDPPSWGWIGNHPMVNITWYDAVNYTDWVSERKNLVQVYEIEADSTIRYRDTIEYRLPTEAEWEYAARGGLDWKDTLLYAGGDSLNLVGWWGRNSDSRTHSVGTREPNQLGIFDMSGNVWEWCWDWYGPDYYEECMPQTAIKPRGPDDGNYRVLRGGSWFSNDYGCRVSYRDRGFPDSRDGDVGFRCVRAF